MVIRAFRAKEDASSCQAYLHGHRKVLADIGVTNVLTAAETWCEDDNTYVLVAEHAEFGMVGGLRLQVDDGENDLPMMSAIRSMDPRIGPVMRKLAPHGNAELCGLWNSKEIAGRGLPNILGFAAVALASQIGIQSMVGFVAHYTLRYALKVGFTIMEDVGDGGVFSYPVPNIKSIALVIPDVLVLENAPTRYRQQIMSLRIRPDQVRHETITTMPLEVVYRLLLDRKILTLETYGSIVRERLRHTG